MRTLLNVLIKYHFVLLFVLFEIISIRLVVVGDVEKKDVVLSSANSLIGSFYNRFSIWKSYFRLAQENEILMDENLKLRLKLQKFVDKNEDQIILGKKNIDSTQYSFIQAKVINSSIYKKQNYFTINRGVVQGIEKGMGVISKDGVAGVVSAVSNNYALVVSLLNNRFGISAKLKASNYFGLVNWQENNYHYADLMDIPNQIKIKIGDTVVTSGFSAIFPENILLGTIAKVDINVSNHFYDIKIKLATDFSQLYKVYVISNKGKKEQLLLENSIKNEY